MKKYTILALALALCGSLLVGCGCSNSGSDMTTVPPTKAPTTAPTTAATTAPTTMPQTEPTAMDGNTNETAGDNGLVTTDPSETTGIGDNARSRSNQQIPPIG